MRWLDHIYEMSPDVRGHLAFWTAFVIVGVITILWVFTLPVRFVTVTQDLNASSTYTGKTGDGGSFTGILDTISDSTGEVVEQFQQLKETVTDIEDIHTSTTTKEKKESPISISEPQSEDPITPESDDVVESEIIITPKQQ